MIPVNQGNRESRRTIKPLCVLCDLCGKNFLTEIDKYQIWQESSQLYNQNVLEIFIQFKDKHAIAGILGNAKILAEASGVEGVLKEFLNSTLDS